jgi:hypothetical protein
MIILALVVTSKSGDIWADVLTPWVLVKLTDSFCDVPSFDWVTVCVCALADAVAKTALRRIAGINAEMANFIGIDLRKH